MKDKWKEDWKRAIKFFEAANRNFRENDPETAINRAYNAAESAVTAALGINSLPLSSGPLSIGQHSGIHRASGALDVKIGIYYLLTELYSLRLNADYGERNETFMQRFTKKPLEEYVREYIPKVRHLMRKLDRKYKLEENYNLDKKMKNNLKNAKFQN